MNRILIINGDDFGQSRAANRGIVEAHLAGGLPCATLMAGGDAAKDAAFLARTHPTLDVGIHLTLNETLPCAQANQVNGLLAGERFPPRYPEIFRRLLRRPALVKQVEAEWRAQYQRFLELGLPPPSHADSHQHVHLLPLLWPVHLKLAREFAVKAVRAPVEAMPVRGTDTASEWKVLTAGAGISWMGLGYRLLARRRGMFTTNHFFGFFDSGRFSMDAARRLFNTISGGVTELMVHPGAENEPSGYQRRTETETLCSSEFRAMALRHGATIASFRDVFGRDSEHQCDHHEAGDYPGAHS
ncbi:MAG: Chitooligosaccharide deacetylase ChbG [Myxococcota bacterium]|nr:Chitooligosaccharide deacetylase ChbG [Myxococcota bacterium]